MTAWWYWLLFALACLAVTSVPLLAWLERRADRQDKAAWDRIHMGISSREDEYQSAYSRTAKGQWETLYRDLHDLDQIIRGTFRRP